MKRFSVIVVAALVSLSFAMRGSAAPMTGEPALNRDHLIEKK